MKSFSPFIIIGFFLFSCNQEDVDVITFEDCDGEAISDSLGLVANLTGSWVWAQEECYCCASCQCVTNYWVSDADKEVIATFNSDTSFSVSEDGDIVMTGNWSVQPESTGFVISLSNHDYYNHYFSGSINICDNRMIADSFSGCRQLYLKINSR